LHWIDTDKGSLRRIDIIDNFGISARTRGPEPQRNERERRLRMGVEEGSYNVVMRRGKEKGEARAKEEKEEEEREERETNRTEKASRAREKEEREGRKDAKR
jgi:hypothetical protein